MARDDGESATYDDNDGVSPAAGNRPARSCIRNACGCEYDPVVENLDYDYGYDETKRGSKPQPMPRMRTKGEFYVDSFNGEPWGCSFGTGEEVRANVVWNVFVGFGEHQWGSVHLQRPMMRNLFAHWMYAALVPGWQFITMTSHWFFFSHQFISQWSTPPTLPTLLSRRMVYG